jgi:hypothetical protein
VISPALKNSGNAIFIPPPNTGGESGLSGRRSAGGTVRLGTGACENAAAAGKSRKKAAANKLFIFIIFLFFLF